MLGMKKRNDFQMVGSKKRDAMLIGSKHRVGKSSLGQSPVQESSPAQQKSVLERMKKTGQNMGQYS